MKLNDILLPHDKPQHNDEDDEDDEEEEEEEAEEKQHDEFLDKDHYRKQNILFGTSESASKGNAADIARKITPIQTSQAKVTPSQLLNFSNALNANNNSNNLIHTGNFNLINFANINTSNSSINLPNLILQQQQQQQQHSVMPPKLLTPTALGNIFNMHQLEQHQQYQRATNATNNNIFLSQFQQTPNTKILSDLIQIQQQQQFELLIKELIHQQQLQLIQQQQQQVTHHHHHNNNNNNSFNSSLLFLNHHQNQLQQQQQQQQFFRQSQQFMPIILDSSQSQKDLTAHEPSEQAPTGPDTGTFNSFFKCLFFEFC